MDRLFTTLALCNFCGPRGFHCVFDWQYRVLAYVLRYVNPGARLIYDTGRVRWLANMIMLTRFSPTGWIFVTYDSRTRQRRSVHFSAPPPSPPPSPLYWFSKLTDKERGFGDKNRSNFPRFLAKDFSCEKKVSSSRWGIRKRRDKSRKLAIFEVPRGTWNYEHRKYKSWVI